jgi:hypothetical protein
MMTTMMMQTTDTIAHEMAQEILHDPAFRADLLDLVRRFVKRRPRVPRQAPEDMLRILKATDQKRYDALATLIARAFADRQQPGDEESPSHDTP